MSRLFLDRIILVTVTTACLANTCFGHCLWLASESSNDGVRAILFFGEGPGDRTYHLPERLAKPRVLWHVADGSRELSWEGVDDDELVGLRSAEPLAPAGQLSTTCEYGIYHGTRLIYHASHFWTDRSGTWPTAEIRADSTFDVVHVPQERGDTIRLRVLWKGAPAASVNVSYLTDEGKQQEQVTDRNGEVTFERKASDHAYFIAQYKDDSQKGTVGDSEYSSETHFATVSMIRHGSPADQPKPQARKSSVSHVQAGANRGKIASAIPPLPEGIASFGAVVADGWLFVYGGHTGSEHQHSRENLSRHFLRISLQQPTVWESLPMETAVQGLCLVTHHGLVYRIGGMTALNAADEEEDLHSATDFARFDPRSKTWTALASLPAGRSSHDAVVIGDMLYVIGGWNLSGDGDSGEWHTTGLTCNLAEEPLRWLPLSPQPFQRRALAVGELAGQVVAIGGIDAGGNISRQVDVYDPASQQWRSGPKFPGEGLNGFGVSAWKMDDAIYVNGADGTLYRLRHPDDAWTVVGHLEQPRFFHRLVPFDSSHLLAIGGATRDGHLHQAELITIR